ncbi:MULTISPECIES: transglutaminase-like domain-containing protein [Stappiaceae]|uniref:transglutaminase-like domain-containing protein n=1 Tax=Stappiaceae TaxID=2821832 RepID=UPI0003FEB6E1|nr:MULTISPECIES: transglutaminase-like domain-containing protein [Pseudovibrio]MDD7910804.1 transglutaminase-like domain-containing protein [Pseudovibrio exalbescens]MDX5593488.1 transglutaminase-like domain-containing protein [Pseudovibrio sp. SPO723]
MSTSHIHSNQDPSVALNHFGLDTDFSFLGVECQPGEVLDYLDPGVQNYVKHALGRKDHSDRSVAVTLYYKIRDGIFYEVFGTDISKDGLKASGIINAGRGFCLHKAILYAACCRAASVPCRVVASKVQNHITTPSLEKLVGGKVFLHWYNEVKVDGQWLKTAPVFNSLLCKLYKIEPLEFDGFSDAVHQPHTKGRSMEYLGEPTRFSNPKHSELVCLVQSQHPLMVTGKGSVPKEREFRAA